MNTKDNNENVEMRVQIDPKNILVIVGEKRLARLLYTLPHKDERYCILYSDGTREMKGLNDTNFSLYYIEDGEIGENFDKNERGPRYLREKLKELESKVDSLLDEWNLLFPDIPYPLTFQLGESVA